MVHLLIRCSGSLGERALEIEHTPQKAIKNHWEKYSQITSPLTENSSKMFVVDQKILICVWRRNNGLHLARKYAICSEKRTEICELRGTYNVQGQISEHIFASNGGYCRSTVARNCHGKRKRLTAKRKT